MELSGTTNQISSVEHGKSLSSSVLLTSTSFQPSTETLLFHVRQNQSVTIFLRLMGIIWSQDDCAPIVNIVQVTWNLMIRGGLLLLLAVLMTGFISVFSNDIIVLMALTIFFQVVTIGFALKEIGHRLQSTITLHSVGHLRTGLKSAYVVLVMSVMIAALPAYYFGHLTDIFTFAYFFGEFSLCCLLAATMYFISTDCTVALSLLDQLIEQQKLELLTFEQYSMVRTEVDSCQASSQWINNSIVVVALLDIAVVLIFLFAEGRTTSVFEMLGYFGLLLKEIPFVVVVYWQVAQVNEKSALFNKNLGANRWTSESQTDGERIAIYVKAQSNPIVMSLAGMKLKRKDLAWQLALWCFATSLSVVKAVVINKTE